MMPDLPHTSTPMVMQGRALALKNTCQNASSTSVEKHLSWSPDIHPTARWVPSTPHRSRPAGHPPNRHPGVAGAEKREYSEGSDVEAHDDEDDPRAQHATVGARGNYVNPHPDGDKPRPRDAHAAARPAAAPLPPSPAPTPTKKFCSVMGT